VCGLCSHVRTDRWSRRNACSKSTSLIERRANNDKFDIIKMPSSWDSHIFQQDSAPAHRAWATVEFLEREMLQLIFPLLWPPNSPGLNPVDYREWSILQEKVYKTRITDLDDLKPRIRTEWTKLDHDCCSCASVASMFFQLVWKWVVVISSTAFNSDIRTVVSWYSGLIFLQLSVITCIYTRRSFNSQVKVVTLIRCGGLLLC